MTKVDKPEPPSENIKKTKFLGSTSNSYSFFRWSCLCNHLIWCGQFIASLTHWSFSFFVVEKLVWHCIWSSQPGHQRYMHPGQIHLGDESSSPQQQSSQLRPLSHSRGACVMDLPWELLLTKNSLKDVKFISVCSWTFQTFVLHWANNTSVYMHIQYHRHTPSTAFWRIKR